jgi:chaperonin GroES
MNESGIQPVEFKVLVLPEPVEEMSKGGIILPKAAQEKEQMQQERATVVAVGPVAFTEPDWGAIKPKAGDLVYMSRYAGKIAKGNDGKEYRLINDKDIEAIISQN